MKQFVFALCVTAALGTPQMASAAPIQLTGSYTLGGDTTGTNPYTLTSTGGNAFSVLRFILDTPVLFSDITNINLDYSVISGGIGLGSPRLAAVVDTNNDDVADGQFLILFGPAGSFNDPAVGGPFNTGNFIAMNDVGRYDLGGIGGSAYTNYSAALALAGSYEILRLSLIVDGPNQTITTSGVNAFANVDAAAVPEPTSLLLLGSGVVAAARRRRKN